METSRVEACCCTRIRSCKLCNKRPLYEPTRIDTTNAVDVPGLILLPDFLTLSEEKSLVQFLDNEDTLFQPCISSACSKDESITNASKVRNWTPSQSGRRKQDFGPKINFLRRRAKLDTDFEPIPGIVGDALRRLSSCTEVVQPDNYEFNFKHSGTATETSGMPYGTVKDVMHGFRAAEMVALEYSPVRGSHIDPHLDDTWAWGPRIVGFNLLSGTELIFTMEHENLNTSDSSLTHAESESWVNQVRKREVRDSYVARITVPRRAVYVLSGPSRYYWKHAIATSNISSRRISLTFRELTDIFITDFPDIAKKLLEANKRLHEST